MSSSALDFNHAPRQEQFAQRVPATSVAELLDTFRQRLNEAGLEPIELVPDGNLQRCPVAGKPRGRDGAYIVHLDHPASVWCQNFVTGEVGTSCPAQDRGQLTPADRQAIEQRKQARREQMERDKAAKLEAIRKTYDAATPASPDHPYLARKGIELTEGVRQSENALLVPVMDAHGQLQGLQRIFPDGSKRHMAGSTITGGSFLIPGGPGPVYVAEGYATGRTIHEATGCAVLCAFDVGNLRHVAESLRAQSPDAEIVLAADNDCETAGNPGLTKAKDAAVAVGARVVVPELPGGAKGDFNDLHGSQGLDAVREQIAKQLETAKPSKPSRMRLLAFGELLKGVGPRDWSIKGMFARGETTVLFGDPASKKSFMALDMGLCIATGKAWHGHQVKRQGAVVYIAGEGFKGIGARLKAWAIKYQIHDNVPFFASDRAVQMMDDASVEEMRAVIREEIEATGVPPELVIIDTLARNFGAGDENSSADMSRFITMLDDIKREFDCGALVVHHTGHGDKGRARGSSSLKAGVDNEYSLSVVAGGQLKLTCPKIKDAQKPDDHLFSYEVVPLGVWDEDGRQETSLVLNLEKCTSPGKNQGVELNLTNSERVVVQAFLALGREQMDAGEGMDLNSPTMAEIDYTDLRDRAIEKGVSGANSRDSQRRAFSKALNGLVEKSVLDGEAKEGRKIRHIARIENREQSENKREILAGH